MRVAIIGGGAAGFMAAISAKSHHPKAEVVILEKGQSVLSKVKVSGGGRCNVTNSCKSITDLCKGYPRGGKKLKKLFSRFSNQDTIAWFEKRGVKLHAEADGRMFPVTNNSQTIVDSLMGSIKELGIELRTNAIVDRLEPNDRGIGITFRSKSIEQFDKVIVASGGAPKRRELEWLEVLGHRIEEPVPSLFTFNMPKEPITKLMGVVAEPVLVRIEGSKLKAEGPLLITHWGMSGPAILKLSAFGARQLGTLNYQFVVLVNWVNLLNDQLISEQIQSSLESNRNKQISNWRPFDLPSRLWMYLLDRAEIKAERKCHELGKNAINKLTQVLSNDRYQVKGKTTFKEEFVTCGGISLDSVDLNTMESKHCKGLYFAGEILDIDGITGGYNFQAAWTTAQIAGKLDSTDQ